MVEPLSRADLGDDTGEVESSSVSAEDIQIESRQSSVEVSPSTQEARLSQEADDMLEGKENLVKIKTIDVACGKERMTVRVSFDDRFDGIIYAKVSTKSPKYSLFKKSIYLISQYKSSNKNVYFCHWFKHFIHSKNSSTFWSFHR